MRNTFLARQLRVNRQLPRVNLLIMPFLMILMMCLYHCTNNLTKVYDAFVLCPNSCIISNIHIYSFAKKKKAHKNVMVMVWDFQNLDDLHFQVYNRGYWRHTKIPDEKFKNFQSYSISISLEYQIKTIYFTLFVTAIV